MEVQVALIIVEDVVDLLPAKSLESLELRFRAGTLPIVKETGLGHLLLIIRRVRREERLISRLLLERLDLILPLLVKAIQPHDLLSRQVELFLKLGIVERTEPLILHLDLAESLALERASKELLGLGCKLLVELAAKLSQLLLTLLVA